jgi:hypothetical protein
VCYPPCLDYRIVFLSCFSNIKSLVINGTSLVHAHTSLLRRPWRRNLSSVFWNLTDLWIQDPRYFSHETIAPFLQLPKLQSLVLSSFNQRVDPRATPRSR